LTNNSTEPVATSVGSRKRTVNGTAVGVNNFQLLISPSSVLRVDTLLEQNVGAILYGCPNYFMHIP